MNIKLLRKVIEELKKDKPEIQYVLGILETLAEMQGEPTVSSAVIKEVPMAPGTVIPVSEPETDEAKILDAKARAALAQVQALSQQSQDN